MTDIAALDKEMNDMLLQGDVMGAFEKFTADDVVMIEPGQEPFVGKETNRKREGEFFEMVEEFHGNKLISAAVNGNVSFGEWESVITFKGAPAPYTMHQIERRKWNDDGTISEIQFFYKPMM